MHRVYFLALLMVMSERLAAHSYDSTLSVKNVFTITNNGFSIVPAFSLGKPAFLFDLALARKRFSFEPQFRYSLLNARPWIFNFNFRYRLLDKSKTALTVGGFLPALNFVHRKVIINGIEQEIQTVRRFISGELFLTQRVSKTSYVGIYYLQGKGLQSDGPRNINYMALRGGLQKIKLSKNISLEVSPQVYYLKVDENSGIYFNETILLSFINIPISFSSTINKAISSDIPAKYFDWNLSLHYTIHQQFISHHQ